MFISVGVLLLLLLGAGAAYTWFMGQDDTASRIVAPVETTPTPVIKHVAPAANAKVGVSVQSLTSPVAPGSNASISVRTLEKAKCTITVKYNEVASTDSGLSPKVVDESGTVSWSWTVEPSVPLGTWPVEVTCARAKLSAVVKADLVVKN